jgi:MFS family permease
VNASTTARPTTRSGSRWLALAVLCVSLLVIVIDNTIVNVTLPTLVRDLNADLSELQWVVDAYTLVFAGLLLLAGTLGRMDCGGARQKARRQLPVKGEHLCKQLAHTTGSYDRPQAQTR